MKTIIKLTGIALAALLAMPANAADVYKIDSSHSIAAFKVAHLVVSKTKGSFADMNGEIHLDSENIKNSKVMVSIDTASVNTNNEDRDEHLRSADFFDVEQFPTMSFESTRVTEESKGSYVAHGKLTMHGVSKAVSLPFSINGPITDPWGNVRIGVEVDSITIDRQDFGLGGVKAMEGGGLIVGNEVEIELGVEAIKVTDEG